MVEFVVTAAAVLRDNISVNDVCEAHDSSTCFDFHSAVTCMGFTLEIEYVPQHQQCLTMIFFRFKLRHTLWQPLNGFDCHSFVGGSNSQEGGTIQVRS